MINLFFSLSSSSLILFDQKIEKEQGKVGIPIHVTYTIINLGEKNITDLEIKECAIPPDQWSIPETASNLKWRKLEPGSKISHIFEVIPLIEGSLRMGSTLLTYVDDGFQKKALSSEMFFFEATKSTSIGVLKNMKQYSTVIFYASGLIFIPFFIWFLVKSPKKDQKEKNQ